MNFRATHTSMSCRHLPGLRDRTDDLFLVRFVLCLCSLDLQIGKRHSPRNPISQCTRTLKSGYPQRYPHARLAPAEPYWTTKAENPSICWVFISSLDVFGCPRKDDGGE